MKTFIFHFSLVYSRQTRLGGNQQKMNRQLIQGLLTSLVIYPMTSVAALHTFTAHEVASFEWGTEAEQIALTQAPANNFGPPSVLVDETGRSLYLLDSENQRILVFNTTNNTFSSIWLSSIPLSPKQASSSAPLSPKNADDLCVMDDGMHFYLLFSRNQKVILYNRTGKVIRTYPIGNDIIPIGIRCHKENGLVFEAFDGQFYHQYDNKALVQIPIGKYAFHVERHNDSQGTIWLHNNETELGGEISVKSQTGLLKTINFIGLDKDKNIYLSVEEVVGEESLTENSKAENVRRFLRKYTPKGELLAQVQLPYSLYAYTYQDLAVTPSGDVFQIVPLKESFEVVKWRSGVQTKKRSPNSHKLSQKLFSYTESQSKDFHPSETDDGVAQQKSDRPKQRGYRKSLSRKQIIRQARAYANHRFKVRSANITPRRGTRYGRKRVITPIRRRGSYRGIPYKWGGNNSIASFKAGLRAGKKAGDKCTAKNRRCRGKYFGSSRAVGVDCSGLISQVWGLEKKYGTSRLPRISARISKNKLRPGDILNKPGHVMLFSHKNRRGRFCVYEASARDWKVAARCYSRSQIREYRAYRYNRAHSSNKRPAKLYVYGSTSLAERQSGSYTAKLRYSDGSSKEVTSRVSWTVKRPYDKSRPPAYFSGSRLHTKSVNRDEKVYVKASYTEKGKRLIAQTPVFIRNTRSQGWWWW